MRVPALPAALLLLCVSYASTARAEFWLGIESMNGLTGANLEWAGEAGSAYLLLGSYQSKQGFDTDSLTGVIGVRRYQDDRYDSSGYFGGLLLGDVDGAVNYNRYGGGGEFGYQWVTRHLRMTLHGALVIVGETSGGGPTTTDMEPKGIFGASANMRFP